MKEKFQKLIEECSTVILDKTPEIKLAIVCLLGGGHLLIEDLPGVGKTTLVVTLGKLLGLETRRVQFTIDLLPADILGGQIFNPIEQKFIFHPGPVFCQLLMADELNRTSPRTQSALLQAMEEGYVTVDGKTLPLPSPFFVIATQNPQHQSGTFALPESQLDRFLMSLELHYAAKETEAKLFQSAEPRRAVEALQPLFTAGEIENALRAVEKVHISPPVAGYIAQILENSRQGVVPSALPLSTRAGMSLARAAKAWAFMEGRDFVRPEDVQQVFVSVLGHRLGGSHGIKKGRQWALELLNRTSVQLS